ncbi:MAG TPA: type II secretion system F family protein [Clostridiaceae bacterium]|jgi:type IV pilus assembly protein PilC|nr:type II secretion system F family protein [Clostridiaceae bacterium]
MITYKYKALSKDGMAVEGVIKAHDRNDAVFKLKNEYGIIVDIKEVTSLDLFTKKEGTGKVKDKDIALMCQQFSILLTAGLPIARTVELVGVRSESKVLKQILTSVAEDVTAGYNLAGSFQTRAKNLPVNFIETIRAGEESGSLEMAFGRLASFFEKKANISGKVKSALTYPIMVIIVAVIVIAVIMGYAVPVFTNVFVGMGVELPLPTRILIAMSDFFKVATIPIICIIAVLIIMYRLLKKKESWAIRFDKIKLKLPVVGKINIMNAASQFANTFSTMLAAGVPAVRALGITARSLPNAYMADEILNTVGMVEQGYSIGNALRQVNELPELLVEMTAVGEDSGSMEHTLEVVGHYYDTEVEYVTSRAVKLIEPVIIVVLAAFVAFILLSVYLPMFSMYDSI